MDTKQYYNSIKDYLILGSLSSISKNYFVFRLSGPKPITRGSAYQIVQKVLYRIQLGDKLTPRNVEILHFFNEEAEKNFDVLQFKGDKPYPWEHIKPK